MYGGPRACWGAVLRHFASRGRGTFPEKRCDGPSQALGSSPLYRHTSDGIRMEMRVDDELPALVKRSQRRDAAAFALLIRRCEKVALSIAYAQLGDANGAGDAVQEGVFRAWQRIGDLEDPARF